MLLQMSTVSRDVKRYSQNVCDYADAPAEKRGTWMKATTQVGKQLQREKNKHVDILPHVRLKSKWLVVDYFRRCKAQRNERFNSNQMWRSETHSQGLIYLPAWAHTRTKTDSEVEHFYSVFKLFSPTNSGVPKMFLNSFPALIWWAIPKSISLILGLGTFLSSSMIFSGWKINTIKLNISERKRFWYSAHVNRELRQKKIINIFILLYLSVLISVFVLLQHLNLGVNKGLSDLILA